MFRLSRHGTMTKISLFYISLLKLGKILGQYNFELLLILECFHVANNPTSTLNSEIARSYL